MVTEAEPAPPRRLALASGNPGKLREIRRVLADLPVEVLGAEELEPGWEPPEETGDTYAANALLKARDLAVRAGVACLADDSGLEVDALGGAPGVRSARYAPTTEERNAKLLAELEGVEEARRTARFRCLLALVWPEGPSRTFQGVLEGRIAREPRGEGGFGYDPVFWLPERERSVAELAPEEKDVLSHRGRALAALRAWLVSEMAEA